MPNHSPFGMGNKMHYCYIVQAWKHVKIGYTRNLDDRIANIQTGNPYELILICKFVFATEEAAREYELSLQHRLRKYHVRGEWFEAGPVVAYLNKQGKFTEQQKSLLEPSECDELEIAASGRRELD